MKVYISLLFPFLAAACSSGTTATESLPLQTTDPTAPSAHPGWYDTQIVTHDAHGSQLVIWQHTTPEQYAHEVAAHTHTPLAQATQAESGEAVGTSSAALISQDTGCAGASVWLYNYVSIVGGACSAPDGWGNLRICFDNSDGTNWDSHYLVNDQFYQCTQGGYCQGPYSWAGHVQMVWAGDEAGNLGQWVWYWNGTGWQYIYVTSTTWSAGQTCTQTSYVDQASQSYVALQ